MDPDAALANAREAAKVAEDAANGDSDSAELYALREALEAYGVLDDWITKGGFLPAAWANKT